MKPFQKIKRAPNLGKFPDVCRMLSSLCGDDAFLHIEESAGMLLLDGEYEELIKAAEILGYEIEVKND